MLLNPAFVYTVYGDYYIIYVYYYSITVVPVLAVQCE